MKSLFAKSLVFVCASAIVCWCCQDKPQQENAHFTKADSLTDTFLALEDSMYMAWTEMINDDNRKLNAMHNLLHELLLTASDKEQIKNYEERLDQLQRSRYTQKTMANMDVVEEYDFASNALVSELITLSESQSQFAYNTTLQKLVDEIRAADQRVNNYREQYDVIAASYNNFVKENHEFLRDVSSDSLAQKPLFQMALE